MRILWVSTRIFDDKKETTSGVWLKALANLLDADSRIVLGNVSRINGIDNILECDYKGINQWAIPYDSSGKKRYLSRKAQQHFENIVAQFKPDIIQVWGSENPFKLFPFVLDYPCKVVLCMQGVLSSMGPNCLRGFTAKEMISTIGIRELIKGDSIFSIAKSFYREGKVEDEMVRKSRYIITQSDWTYSQVASINGDAKFYRIRRVLRDAFISSKKWPTFCHEKPIIFTSALGYSWKALHVLVKSLPFIKEKFPEIQIRIAGKIGRTDFLGNGYLRMMLKYIKTNNLERNVFWVGDLNAEMVVKNLQEATVFVHPSYVESYSNSVAEAMSVGTPSVISFAGAMPERAVNNKEALFFTPGDFKFCAYQIIKLIENKNLALEISQNAIIRAERDNLQIAICEEQIAIYEDILKH